MKNLNIEELAKKFKELDYETLIKALFLFEKSELMEELNLSQRVKVLNRAYRQFIDSDTITSFLQEDIDKSLDEMIKKVKEKRA